ncbi:MAG: hypothetical protein ABSG84_15830 [Acidobacteriaceae bacterium]|jgi:hypothetical protein
MRQRIPRARFLPLLLACAVAAPLRAQQLIGYVNTRDANITGASDVLDGQAVLTGSVSVTARDHTAPITLGRGGTARVCQTSVLHLTESKTPVEPAPLLFSLDRGAIEIQTAGTPNDSIMTPDLRFSVHNAGPLDLRLRIARNGDTCVDNRGPGAPTLAVSDPFGEAMYEVAPGQHVLFEHGSLHEVVDHETSPCGCPEEKGVSVADALLAPPNAVAGPGTPPAPPPMPGTVAAPAAPPAAAPPAVAPVPVPAVRPTVPAVQVTLPPAAPAAVAAPAPIPQTAAPVAVPTTPPVAAPAAAPVVPEQAVEQAAAEAAARAAALHPFPTAISEGLAPTATAPPPAPGAPPIIEPLHYDAPIPPPNTASQTASAASAKSARSGKTPKAKASHASVQTAKPPAAPAPPANDLVHLIGRFFSRLFGRG